jgi:hypothetical protein
MTNTTCFATRAASERSGSAAGGRYNSLSKRGYFNRGGGVTAAIRRPEFASPPDISDLRNRSKSRRSPMLAR